MGWFGKRPENPPEQPTGDVVALRMEVDSLRREVARVKASQDEMAVDLEDFVSKVSKAARRAYKREMDSAKQGLAEAASPMAMGEDRASRKARLRALRGSNGTLR